MKASIYTLGCRVNQYESDALSERLCAVGFEIVPFGTPCDITVVNTCTVTAESDRKSRQLVRRAAAYSKGGAVIVTGCFAQVAPDDAEKLGAACVVGNGDKDKIAEIALRIAEGGEYREKVTDMSEVGYDSLTVSRPKRVRTFVKIEDGCENKCAYCIIPRARGRVRSKAPQEVLREVGVIAAAGCGEIILTGIETASYGRDLGHYGLGDLIRDVSRVEGVRRIALGSLDPSAVNAAFMDKVADIDSLLPHFHLSLQSGCTKTLNRMRRRYTAERVLENMDLVRSRIPDVTFSADIITGFPGESEQDFLESARFCASARFMHLHIFPYSERKGTEAEKMPDKIPETERKRRAAFLAKQQEAVQGEILDSYIAAHSDPNSPVYVLCEKQEEGVLFGHTEHFAECRIQSENDLTGKIIPTVLKGREGAVLEGAVAECEKQK